MNIKVKIKRLTETAIVPEYQSVGAGAFDLCANTDRPINSCPRDSALLIPTGLAIQIPSGYVGIIIPRSGLGHRDGIVLGNGIGVIDSDYRGEIKVSICNRESRDVIIYPNNRIAQMLIMPVVQAEFIEVDELDGTERGSGGFGSTGV